MVDSNRTIKDILKVAASNILKLIAGTMVAFLLPRIIGVADYGYYKTFTLYSTYIGLLHLGFCDGIYLEYGGKNYSDLNKCMFSGYSKLFFIMQTCIAVILIIIAWSVFENEWRFILICLSFCLLFTNITGYYQIISQVTNRFGELSILNTVQSALIVLSIVVLWGMKVLPGNTVTYRLYVVLYLSVLGIMTLWYIITYRDITFNKNDRSNNSVNDAIRFIKIGFPLTIANLCSSLILTLDRQFVNILFDTKTYAVYAFAYNMLSLITTALAAISTVLYPKLKQKDDYILKLIYPKLIGIILVLTYCSMIVYYPLLAFVNWFLPQYNGSLVIFRIIFPGLAISSAITIIMHNYYKTLGETFQFFIKSIVTLVVSGVANAIAYFAFGTTISISIASVITMIFWYIYIERFFVRTYKIEWFRNFAYLLIMMSVFYMSTAIHSYVIGMFVYMLGVSMVTLLFYNTMIKEFIKR